MISKTVLGETIDKTMLSDPLTVQLFNVLLDEKFMWRTFDGLRKALKWPAKQLDKVLSANIEAGNVVVDMKVPKLPDGSPDLEAAKDKSLTTLIYALRARFTCGSAQLVREVLAVQLGNK
jgi:hypothetical protein